MVLEDGKSIEATADHRFLFAGGWDTLRGATGVRETGGRAVWRHDDYFVHVNGAAEKLDWDQIRYKAKLVRIARFEYVGERETYDLEVEGPHHNFVANGIVTHNSVNEYSGRYSLMPLLFYSPEQDQFSLQSATSNQGRAPGSVSPEFYREAMRRWDEVRGRAADDYGWLVGENVARELARIDLPLSTYTQWYWKIDLHNLLHFLTLRVDDHAQWEIQEYGRVMAGMVKRVAPLSYEAWVDYQVMGDKLSGAEIAALSRLVSADADGLAARGGAGLSNAELAGLGLSGREIRELKEKLVPREVPDYELDLATMRDPQDVAAEMDRAVPEVDRG
ncbi:MAG: FAD-dependent thymidylate synthase [Gemmatimonadota bacterium]|nr:FAD-dependent thymidylate synthase [Gemmatimonadota bacterium]